MAKCAAYEMIRQEAELPTRGERWRMWLLHWTMHRCGLCPGKPGRR